MAPKDAKRSAAKAGILMSAHDNGKINTRRTYKSTLASLDTENLGTKAISALLGVTGAGMGKSGS